MMLVVAVALSTATYAWFTSNTSVTAETITMTAGTSQSTALGIEWSAGTAGDTFNAHYGTTITSVTPSLLAPAVGGFQPAAPVELDVETEPVFKTAFVNAQGEFQTNGGVTGVYRFANYVDNAAATTAEDTYSNLIHIANLAQAGAAPNVYLVASISGEAAALVRIAVYEVVTTAEPAATTYTYKGLLSATPAANDTAEGAIEEGNEAADLLTATSTAELNLGTLAAQTDKAYAIYVWLDGAAFDEASSSNTATIGLTFSTAKTSVGDVAEINGPSGD